MNIERIIKLASFIVGLLQSLFDSWKRIKGIFRQNRKEYNDSITKEGGTVPGERVIPERIRSGLVTAKSAVEAASDVLTTVGGALDANRENEKEVENGK